MFLEEIAAEFGDAFNATATTYTNDAGETVAYNASYYKEWYTVSDSSKSVKEQVAESKAEYTAVNETFNLVDFYQ